MKEGKKVVPYIRKNRAEAAIYVRGHNKEFQEMMCRLYAVDKGYEISYVAKHFKDVNLCDVLLVTDPSRISRDALEYYKIVKEFSEKGIKIEYAVDANDSGEYASLLIREMFSKEKEK